MSSKNDALFERSLKAIPGGVNSPVRAFRAVGGTPRFIARATAQPVGERPDQEERGMTASTARPVFRAAVRTSCCRCLGCR